MIIFPNYKNGFKMLILLLYSGVSIMCQNGDKVYDIFISEIKKHGFSVKEKVSENIVKIQKDDVTYNVNLENVRKNYLRDNDSSSILQLVENVIGNDFSLPSWNESRARIYFSAEAADNDLNQAIFEKITNTFYKVYIYYDEKRIIWITKHDLTNWNITITDLINAANVNMKAEIENIKIEAKAVKDHNLYIIDSSLPFKASLVLSPFLKEKIEKIISWPVYGVIPVRDFTYLFKEEDKDFFIGRLGKIVLDEYSNSGYPITTEVLLINDNGIKAIGKY